MARAKKEAALTPEERLQAALVPDWEWPYKLPENWCWVYAPHIFDIEYGKGLPTKQLSDTGYPVFGANGQIGFYSEYMYKEPQALMSCRGAYSGTMNKSLPYSYVTSNSLIISSPRGLMGTDCIYYLFSALNVSELISGTAQPQVTVQAFDGFPIPLSPLAEQQRIVDRIESLFAKLDEAKEKAQAVVDSFETRKVAILHKAFTGELTAKWREEHGVRMESWKTRELAECFEIVSGIQKTPARSPKDNPVPYLTVANVYRGRIDLSDIRYFEVTSKEIEKLKLQDKDILIVEGNGSGNEIGRCAIWHNELPLCIHQNHIIRMRRKTADILPEYALHYLNSEAGKSIMRERSKTTAGLFNLSAGKIKTIPLPMASLDEQSEIIHLIDSLLEKEQWAKESAEAALDQIDLMKKSILARAFRGELGTNDPSEESAVKLLRQVIEQEDGDVIRPKAKAKRIAIPAEIKPLLSGSNEEAIVKLLLKAAPQSVSTQTVMSISKKKFELMDALRNLEKKQIVSKSDSGEYSLVR